jgi:uncharacterized lipoprotein YbaY
VIDFVGKPVGFSFELAYDFASIKSSGAYAIRVKVKADGKLLFQAITMLGVITQVNSNVVQVKLTRVGPASSFYSAIEDGRLARFTY